MIEDTQEINIKNIMDDVAKIMLIPHKEWWTLEDIAYMHGVSKKTASRMIEGLEPVYKKNTKIKHWRQIDVNRFLA